MTYVLPKELMKFIFSIIVLTVLMVGLVIIVFSQVSKSVDMSEVEGYNVYRVYKDCNDCIKNYCVNKIGETCKIAKKCKDYGFDKVEVCV